MNNGILENRLKLLRKENGYTQEDIAKKIGLTKSAYGYYEQSKTVPDAYTISKLANIFNVTTDYLLGRTNERTFTLRDEKSIQKDLKKIMEEFKTGEAGPVYYDGVEFESDELELIENAMETALKIAKLKNKEKYTPNKYKNSNKG
ncbi:helix-turn-helix domain-containing protein [Intestinibacter sp.]|uniref:helix-turn-helix domain-containing protein n=1 Tax=Intestinibacter sp. TaxID=1965304 RepID=UPI002A75F39E|nr:helix-turn-helix transcriptional regulator [Intestinibacter sp.]MDY2734891.1 helix-turn-helix transcriptional regulator [Intestinibacter sp.]